MSIATHWELAHAIVFLMYIDSVTDTCKFMYKFIRKSVNMSQRQVIKSPIVLNSRTRAIDRITRDKKQYYCRNLSFM